VKNKASLYDSGDVQYTGSRDTGSGMEVSNGQEGKVYFLGALASSNYWNWFGAADRLLGWVGFAQPPYRYLS
jgi:hypothetical protein